MTDNTPAVPTENETQALQKLADAYEKEGAIKQGYRYKWVTSGGQTRVVVTKIERKKA